MQINRQTYEEFFLLYADGELNESEKKAVEDFIGQNPDLAGEFTLISETILKADGSIVFENKELLFKDQEEKKKVIYMRWYRLAAAAILLIAFSTGWLFLSNKNTHQEPVAINKHHTKTPQIAETVESKQKNAQKEQAENANDIQKNKDVAVAGPAIKHDKMNKQKKSGDRENILNYNKKNKSEPDLATQDPVEKLPESSALTHDIVKTENVKETIDITIAPRAMEKNNEQTAPNVYYAQSYKQEPDNDIIYFANTSLTKKTKLRGVLRKATRYLDRVTSLQ
ncbi:MAG TPA: hypothetical protein VM101_10345 [Flavitalea sp.]|nr:hypothetical protein [Flavitalea sp.]